MTSNSNVQIHHTALTLVLGATGKSGKRVLARLAAKGVPVRAGSRAASPAFDWDDPSLWPACLEGVVAVYISYSPDLAMIGAQETIRAFVLAASRSGVSRLVLLSGRGEAEAEACERIVQQSGLEWTIVRSSWFSQNFTEGVFAEMVVSGTIALPAGDTPEPFIDLDDVADVAVAALSEPGHAGQLYEVTGPRLLTMGDVASELANATQRPVRYCDVPLAAFIAEVRESGAPEDIAWLLEYLFSTVLDGRNAHLSDGVMRALGRPAKDFANFAHDAVIDGVWRTIT